MDGERQNITKTKRIKELEQELINSRCAMDIQGARNSDLEKQMRRVVAMLWDALRTGTFADHAGHVSLLARVKEDAPEALRLLPQTIVTPDESGSSRQSSTPPIQEMVDAQQHARGLQNHYHFETSLQPACNMILRDTRIKCP